jgi:uncharacterized protein (TIGR02300 family)
MEILMSKPEWGVKRTCLSCGARFYDLKHDPVICPKCDAEFDTMSLQKPKRLRPSVDVKVANKTAPDKDEDLIDDDADEDAADEDAATDDDDADIDDGDDDVIAAKEGDDGLLDDDADDNKADIGKIETGDEELKDN